MEFSELTTAAWFTGQFADEKGSPATMSQLAELPREHQKPKPVTAAYAASLREDGEISSHISCEIPRTICTSRSTSFQLNGERFSPEVTTEKIPSRYASPFSNFSASFATRGVRGPCLRNARLSLGCD